MFFVTIGKRDIIKLFKSEKSSAVFEENSVDEIWVSPLKRAQETFTPFKEKNIGKSIHTYEWLQEMQDEEEEALYGKGTEEVMAFFAKRNSQSFEEWSDCLLYTSPSPRDQRGSRMPSSA